MTRLSIILALTLALSGCASASWNPLKWVYGRKAATVEKVQVSEVKAEDQAASAAQVEVFKTTLALAQAKIEQPNFAPVVIADRTAANALALMQQRSPLTVAAQSQAREIVEGLLSAEASRRVSAEAAQARAEGANAKLSAQLDEIRARLDDARKDAAAEAAQNLALANELRWQKIATYAGATLSVLLSIAAIAYKLNIGRLQTGAAEMLAKLGDAHGDKAEATARAALDAALHTGEQQNIFKIYSAITAKK